MLVYHTDSSCTYSLDYMVVSRLTIFLLDLHLIKFQMFISALLAFILYFLVFLKMRGIVRAQALSTSVASADRERDEKYEHKLARQMLLYPVGFQSAGPLRTDIDTNLLGRLHYPDPPYCLLSLLCVDRA